MSDKRTYPMNERAIVVIFELCEEKEENAVKGKKKGRSHSREVGGRQTRFQSPINMGSRSSRHHHIPKRKQQKGYLNIGTFYAYSTRNARIWYQDF